MEPINPSAYVFGGLRLDEETESSGARDLILRCCGYLPKNKHWSFLQIFSPYWRLYYNFSPGHHISHDGRSIPLGPGRFVLIPENVLFHCHSPAGEPGHLYIHFNLRPGHASLLKAPAVFKADVFGIGAARELSRTILKSDPGPVAHVAAALLHWILRNGAAKHSVARLPSVPLQRALAFVETHLSEDLSNGALAEKAGMSVRSLVRMFRHEIHSSPQSYIREMRMREAARRLARSRDTIDRIVDDLGFPNRFYFTRRFTNCIGCPPAEFRRRTLKHNIGESFSHP